LSVQPRRFPLALDRVGKTAAATHQQAVGPARDAVRSAASEPSAPGADFDSRAPRARMVQRLRGEGVRCEPVLDAMASVPRHQFVDSGLAAQAYEDTSLPIGHGQTISKPSVVARMLSMLFEGRDAARSGSLGRVLEIGTGCGYQAAVLSLLAQRMISIERLRPLYERARENLAPMRRDNLRLVYGDGHFGHPPNAPYDAIVCAAGGDDVPSAWLEQMAIGARLIAPMRAGAGSGQVLLVVDRNVEGWSRKCHEAVHFVPLRSGKA
jgi:protein-L-isoaspartate(D-aspartate) O-methyltransferase